MSMMRWDPFEDVAQLRDRVNRLFTQNLAGLTHGHGWAPAVDIYETDTAIVVQVEMSGVKADTIELQVTGDTLTIHGERPLPPEDTGKHYLRVERNHGVFHRAFTLGLPVDAQNVGALYRDGLLEVTLPKKDEVKPKSVKIDIQSAPEAEGKSEE